MIICTDCGEIFDEDDLETTEEYMGECFGFPAYETWQVCPYCGSSNLEDYIEEFEDEDEEESEE